MSDETAKSPRAGIRSARFRTAEARVPATKPSWTDIVSQACPDAVRRQTELRAGTTADAENQTDMPRNWVKQRSPKARLLSSRERRAGAASVREGRGDSMGFPYISGTILGQFGLASRPDHLTTALFFRAFPL